MGYQKPEIHFAPRIVSQTAANSTASTMTLASRARAFPGKIESGSIFMQARI
jgi:hypothetical protein